MTGKQLTLTTTNPHLSNAYARPTQGGVVTLSDETPQAVMALQSLTMGKITAVKRLPGGRLGLLWRNAPELLTLPQPPSQGSRTEGNLLPW